MHVEHVMNRKKLTIEDLIPGMIIWRVHKGNSEFEPFTHGCYIVAGLPEETPPNIASFRSPQIALVNSVTGNIEYGSLGDMGITPYENGRMCKFNYTVRGLPEEWEEHHKKYARNKSRQLDNKISRYDDESHNFVKGYCGFCRDTCHNVKIGDWVRVTAGTSQGQFGLVRRIDPDGVQLQFEDCPHLLLYLFNEIEPWTPKKEEEVTVISGIYLNKTGKVTETFGDFCSIKVKSSCKSFCKCGDSYISVRNDVLKPANFEV